MQTLTIVFLVALLVGMALYALSLVGASDRPTPTSEEEWAEKDGTAMFPSWPLYQKHYRWQLEEACRLRKDCGFSFRDALRDYYVQLFAQHLLQNDAVQPAANAVLNEFAVTGWPSLGDTMLSYRRLLNIRYLLQMTHRESLPGHFLEAGVWRGGGSLYARMVQKYFLGDDRETFVCDSFDGLPLSRTQKHSDENFYFRWHYLKVPLERVRNLFVHHGLMDHAHVHFYKGFFVDSMPEVRRHLLQQKKTIAVLRMDGDMYESTIDILYNLYDLVDVGGYIIVDDFGWMHNRTHAYWGARHAVMDFRTLHGIEDDSHTMVDIDGSAAFWRKARAVTLQRERYPSKVYPVPALTTEAENALREKWDELAPQRWPPLGVF